MTCLGRFVYWCQQSNVGFGSNNNAAPANSPKDILVAECPDCNGAANTDICPTRTFAQPLTLAAPEARRSRPRSSARRPLRCQCRSDWCPLSSLWVRSSVSPAAARPISQCSWRTSKICCATERVRLWWQQLRTRGQSSPSPACFSEMPPRLTFVIALRQLSDQSCVPLSHAGGFFLSANFNILMVLPLFLLVLFSCCLPILVLTPGPTASQSSSRRLRFCATGPRGAPACETVRRCGWVDARRRQSRRC
ncbi:unnamed protein product [Prorocentrum cordatum]|uniref:Uncharacterized protein n=1 Tax=Prorocentrum cordatum TaxID=2364126 RepID=A0ABN9TF03_9DINO|nr:unnamed protein product [Polarella glacialis]